MLMLTCLYIGVLTFFTLHTYQFRGKRMTIKVKEVLKENAVTLFVMMLCVDDARWFLVRLKMGLAYNRSTKLLEFSESQEKLDLESKLTVTEKTSKVLLDIMNDMDPDLKFTTEIVDQFPTGRLPTLDAELWVENITTSQGKETKAVRYNFYPKPISTPFVVIVDTALSDSWTRGDQLGHALPPPATPRGETQRTHCIGSPAEQLWLLTTSDEGYHGQRTDEPR